VLQRENASAASNSALEFASANLPPFDHDDETLLNIAFFYVKEINDFLGNGNDLLFYRRYD